MSLLNKKIQGTLADGKYLVTFVGAKEIAKTDTCNERVQLMFQTDDGRNLIITAFEQQLDFYTRDLINAYAEGQELSFMEVIQRAPELIPVTKYTVESEDIDGNTKRYINYSFNPEFVPKSASAPSVREMVEISFN